MISSVQHKLEAMFSCKNIVCFSFDWRHQSHDLNAVSHDLNAIFERVIWSKCNVDVATFMKTAVYLQLAKKASILSDGRSPHVQK